MSSAGIVRACFKHRYNELLEQGLADDSTCLIDRDEFEICQSKSAKLKNIAKMMNVSAEDIRSAKELERKLVVRDRERALSSLYTEEELAAPVSIGSGAEVVEDHSKVHTTILVVKETSVYHITLMRMWCEARGIPYDSVYVGTAGKFPQLPEDSVGGRVLVLTKGSISPEMRPAFDEWVEASGLGFVTYLDERQAWNGVFPSEDHNDIESKYMGNRWIRFCWDHQRTFLSHRISSYTKSAALEDVMECARLGIPLWAVAKAVGISTAELSDALKDEGFRDDYENCYLGIEDMGVVSASPVADTGAVDAAKVEPVGSEVEPEPEPEPELEPENEPELDPEPEPEPVQANTPRRAEAKVETIEISEPLITLSGAKSIVRTIVNGAVPDEDLWTKSGDGWIIRSYRANIAYRNGVTAYCNGSESKIREASYVHSNGGVLFDRDGLLYKEVGHLVFALADRTTVGVPVVSDYPVRAKRWLA